MRIELKLFGYHLVLDGSVERYDLSVEKRLKILKKNYLAVPQEQRRKIQAIKDVRNIAEISLQESKDMVESWENPHDRYTPDPHGPLV